MRHVIWDWNGTLLDDLPVIVAGANAALAHVGGAAIDAETYRDHYVRPVHVFYERLLGRAITEAEWLVCDDIFRETYHQRSEAAALAADAVAALDAVERIEGTSQSILSMWVHAELEPIVRRYGVHRYMTRIDGNDGLPGVRKHGLLGRHLDALAGHGVSTQVVLIGDSLDDAEAARAHGVPCVLYDGGSHHRRELEATGAPVASGLLDALALAGLIG